MALGNKLKIAVLGLVATAPVLWVLWFKWNADGPGSEGGGIEGKIDAPMAASTSAPEAALQERRDMRATISGVVRDVGERPVAGAMVCAVATSSLLNAADARRPTCSTSGPDGSYRISDLRGVRQRVSAGAAGYLPVDHVYMRDGVRRRTVDLRPGGEATKIDLTLLRGGVEVRGVVRDLAGAPIADAWVASGGPASGTGIGWGRSDADGQYALWVRPGMVTVTAQANGHTPGSATGPSAGHSFAVHLAPESVLVGQVVSAADLAPIEGARVRANAGGEASVTDANGRYRIDALAPGVYLPRVESDDGFGMASEQVRLGLGETSAPLTIAVAPAVFVEGHIVHPGGEPCDDGSVTLRELASGREVRDTTEPSGLVHVSGLLPGSYTVAVTCKGTIADGRRPLVIVGDRAITDARWEVADGRAITGVVTDASEAPVIGATLVARAIDGAGEAATTVSNEAGRFQLRGLPAGEYEVMVAEHPQYTTPDVPVRVRVGDADIADLRVALAATGEALGTLRDPEGRAIAGAEVTLSTGTGSQRTVTGADGGFMFASAAVGRSSWRVGLDGAPLRLRSAPTTMVRAGGSTRVELVSAAVTREITGVLRDADGGALAGALVHAAPEGVVASEGVPAWSVGPRLQVTDAAGGFTLRGLAAAAYTVTAWPVGGGELRRARVKPGGAPALTLAPLGRVTGKVSLHGGGAPRSFTLEVVERTTGRRRSDDFIATAGAWGFGGLPAGSYEVRVKAREGEQVVAFELAAGADRADLRLELVGAATLRGVVLDLDGVPVPGLEVASRSVREVQSDTRFITDAEGRFELARMPVGPAALTVGATSGPPGRFGPVWIAVDVAHDTATIDLPTIRVARRRLAPGESRGDLGFTIVGARAGADPMLADLKVATLRHDGPAASAGLRVFDEVVAVDGHDVRGAHRSLYATLTEVPPGTSVRLGLARGVDVAVVATVLR